MIEKRENILAEKTETLTLPRSSRKARSGGQSADYVGMLGRATLKNWCRAATRVATTLRRAPCCRPQAAHTPPRMAANRIRTVGDRVAANLAPALDPRLTFGFHFFLPFRVFVLCRLRLPFPLNSVRCQRRARLDTYDTYGPSLQVPALDFAPLFERGPQEPKQSPSHLSCTRPGALTSIPFASAHTLHPHARGQRRHSGHANNTLAQGRRNAFVYLDIIGFGVGIFSNPTLFVRGRTQRRRPSSAAQANCHKRCPPYRPVHFNYKGPLQPAVQ